MSRDNGMYILQSPKLGANPLTGPKEYRVAHTTNIENISLEDHTIVEEMKRFMVCEAALFGNSQVHDDANTAIAEACERVEKFKEDEDGGGYIEYGIVLIPRPHPFPDLSSSEALRLLEWREGSRYP